MNSVSENGVSVLRLNLLRVFYAVLFFGLATFIWPEVIHHSSSFAVAYGVRFSLLAGLGAMAGLGLRYPLQMLPLLLFELVWKAIYLIGFALPLYLAHRIDSATAEDIRSVLMVVVFIPCVPWRYVFANYVMKAGERWRGAPRSVEDAAPEERTA
jgi:hypothetical protein